MMKVQLQKKQKEDQQKRKQKLQKQEEKHVTDGWRLYLSIDEKIFTFFLERKNYVAKSN